MEDKQENITEESDRKCVFDSCCCCIPLRTGCLILGYIHLVAGVLGTVTIVLALSGGLASSPDQQEYLYELRAAPVMFIVDCVIAVVYVLVSVLLLIGLHKEIRSFVKIFLVFATFITLVQVIQIIHKGTGNDDRGGEAHDQHITKSVMSTLVSIYYLLVLRSHYIKMGQSANNLPPQLYREDHLMQKADPPAQPLYCPREATDAHTLNRAVQLSCPPKYEDYI